jgi:hypothetical protein
MNTDDLFTFSPVRLVGELSGCLTVDIASLDGTPTIASVIKDLPQACVHSNRHRRCSNSVTCAIATSGTKKQGINANGRRCMSAVFVEEVNPGHR